MSSKAEQKRLMVQYLYRELSAEERAEFEDTYLRDSAIFHELAALENELIDQYILGELSSAERERFERSFLANPARRETVETARSLLSYSAASVNAESSPKFGMNMPWHARRAAQLAAAAVFLLLLGGISWLVVSNRKMANELTKLRQERDTTSQEWCGTITEAALFDAADQAMQDTIPFNLEPATSRGPGKSPTLVIPAHAVYVFLRVVLKDDSHSRYRLSIRTFGGVLVWKQNSFEGISGSDHTFEDISGSDHTKVIVVIIPAHRLPDGDYVLRVNAGGEDLLHTLAGYSFHVTRETQ